MQAFLLACVLECQCVAQPSGDLTIAHGDRGKRVAGVAAALGGELKVVVAPPVVNPLRARLRGKGGYQGLDACGASQRGLPVLPK